MKERQHYRYYPRAGKLHYTMKRVCERWLIKSHSFLINQGEQYYFDHRWLHTIECSNKAVTLMVEDRRCLRPYANVFTASENASQLMVASPALGKIRYRKILEGFAEE
jgi:hypothetical protein